MFTQLHLRDFRGFTELELNGLDRVNLIVGRNNSGKTSLLESIAILCEPGRISGDLHGLLRTPSDNVDERYLRWIVRDGASGVSEVSGTEETNSEVRTVRMAGPEFSAELRRAGQPRKISTAHLDVASSFDLIKQHTIRCSVVSAEHGDQGSLVQLFDRAMSRRDGEETIENLLREVDPRVRRIRIRAPSNQAAFIEVDLGLSERIPLTQVGQGMSRLVSIFSELLGEAPRVCLIDEIENGIHHSLLPHIWRGLIAAARKLDVQIFATTHSYECIVAAHEALSGDSSYDLRIIQLFRYETNSAKDVQGRVLDQRLIEAAIDGEVDLR